MSKKRYTTDQIIRILKEQEEGAKAIDLCRKYGMSEASFYKWKSKYGGMDLNEARRLKALEEENRKLKRLVADQALDILALKEINSKNW